MTHETALVTGALRGLGRAIAERLADEGISVWATDLAAPDDDRVRDLCDRLGPSARYHCLDVACENQWIAARDRVGNETTGLDILVLNAGTSLTGATETLDLEAWRSLMSINLDGVFLGIKTFTQMLASAGADRKGGASIVTMCSIMGNVGFSQAAAYNASKGGVRMLTKATAIEFAARRLPIRVNSVHPGFVATQLTVGGMEQFARREGTVSTQDLLDQLAAQTPMGRLGEPEEIANAAYFLASRESSYMTGSEMIVDGGWLAK